MLTYLSSVRGQPYTYWTSHRWLPNLKAKVGAFPVVDGQGHLDEHLERHHTVKEIKECNRVSARSDHFTFEPWYHQKHAATLMVAAKRFYLADAVGLGKTLTTLQAIVELRSKIQRVLVLCPSSVIYQWKEEIEAAIKAEYRDRFRVVPVRGTPKERDKAYKEPGCIYLMTYESLLADYKRLKGQWAWGTHPDILVLDEAWKVKSRSALTNRALQDLAKPIEYRWALNGTPITNRYEDLYGVYAIIDPLVFLTWKNFSLRYCVERMIRLRNGRQFPKIVGYKNIPELQGLIWPTMIRRTPKDLGWDHAEVLVNNYWVDLSAHQAFNYNKILSANINPLEKGARARIACLFDEPVEDSPKLKQLMELLQQIIPDEKAIVFSESKRYLMAILPFLQQAKINVDTISGDDTMEVRAMKVHKFTKNQTRILLMTAAGEAGLNLQAADVCVNLDLPYSPARLQQRVGRLRAHLGGRDRHVSVLNILARSTIEAKIIALLKEKLNHISQFFRAQADDFTGCFDPDRLFQK